MSQATEYGAEVSATPIVDQVPAAAGETSKSASMTPESPSAEFELTVTALPETAAPAPGAVSEPVGSVASTTQV